MVSFSPVKIVVDLMISYEYCNVIHSVLLFYQQIPTKQLIRLVTVMERHIRDGMKLKQPVELVCTVLGVTNKC